MDEAKGRRALSKAQGCRPAAAAAPAAAAMIIVEPGPLPARRTEAGEEAERQALISRGNLRPPSVLLPFCPAAAVFDVDDNDMLSAKCDFMQVKLGRLHRHVDEQRACIQEELAYQAEAALLQEMRLLELETRFESRLSSAQLQFEERLQQLEASLERDAAATETPVEPMPQFSNKQNPSLRQQQTGRRSYNVDPDVASMG